jgi:cysteine/O-acetylserine efflux protein
VNTAVISAFLTYTVISAITPGPNNILALSSVSTHGLRRSVRVLAGMTCGFLVIMLLCAVFTVMLTHVLPTVTGWLNIPGALYIVWLALKIVRSDPATAQGTPLLLSFWASFALQFANVKIILYGITALSAFVLPYTHNIAVVAAVSVSLALIGAAGNFCWAVAGHLFQVLLRRHARPVNALLACLLIYSAIRLFI